MVSTKVRTRKATMSNKERFEALLRRKRPDRVPFCPGGGGFVSIHSGGTIADQYTWSPEKMYEAEKKACEEFDWLFLPNLRMRTNRGQFGGEVKLPTSKYSQAEYTVKYAAETPEEVMAMKIPDVKTCFSPEAIDFYKRLYRDESRPFPVLSFGCLSVMNTAAGIAGYDRLCQWMIKAPEVAHRLCRLAADHQLAIAQYVKDIFGVEGMMPTGANAAASNQLISPKHFEQFALPYLKEVHEKVLAMGFKHLRTHPCGEQNRNLPYWQQIPLGDPGIFYVGDEIGLDTAEKYLPKDIIEGNLSSTIIQIGTPTEVYDEARKVIEQGKRLSTGFILRQACTLPALAPAENLMAITRALNDFGW
ncbi:MAG: hypothetical protein HYX84_06075, partial [Chloroflexi bacterium]|nr:hypothetical protein [Chloroflexota bacterium]